MNIFLSNEEYQSTFLNEVHIFTSNIFSRSVFFFSKKNILSYLKIFHKELHSLSYFLFSFILIQCKMFSDLLISDFPNYQLRFLSIYNIISIIFNFRIILKTLINSNFVIHSITNLYSSASWFEREAWDMYGVFFLENVDLRRILNDYGFNGHPLKKDFPLSGFLETVFSYIPGVVIYDYIKMIQEFRFFYMNTPWQYYYLKNE